MKLKTQLPAEVVARVQDTFYKKDALGALLAGGNVSAAVCEAYASASADWMREMTAAESMVLKDLYGGFVYDYEFIFPRNEIVFTTDDISAAEVMQKDLGFTMADE